MKICGTYCSIFGVVISLWGIIQLVLMGIFYYFHSVALFEDLPLNEEEGGEWDPKKFLSEVDNGYNLNAMNCWIAACLYVFTLVISGHQFHVNTRSDV